MHMSSKSKKQTCICLTHSVYTKCENGCVFVETNSYYEAKIDYYHGSELELRKLLTAA